MLNELNQKLSEIKTKKREHDRLKNFLRNSKAGLAREQSQFKELKKSLQKEGRDVKKLEGLSLSGIFYTILSSKDQQLDKERQEFLTAKLKFDKCERSIKKLTKEIDSFDKRLKLFDEVEEEYQAILIRKEKIIAGFDNKNTKKLLDLGEELADVKVNIKEIKEAVDAGESACGGLKQMFNLLKSARGWGTWDMLGGGLISTAIKHSKLNKADALAGEVQQQLRRFQQELADVNKNAESDLMVETGSFLTFADYFFDGLIVDWIVQSKIAKSLKNTQEMLGRVENLLSTLHEEQEKQQSRGSSLQSRKTTLVEKV